MPLRFRSVAPFLLPGAVVLFGWWWYSTRKNGQIQGRDKDRVAVGLHASSGDRSNGLMGKCRPILSPSIPCGSTEDHPEVKGEECLEDKLYMTGVPRAPSPSPVSVETTFECSDNSNPVYHEAEAVLVNTSMPQLHTELVKNTRMCTEVEDYRAGSNTSGPLPNEIPATTSVEEVKLPNVARPQPVGEEVASGRITVPSMTRLQAELLKEDQHAMPAVAEQTCTWACRDLLCSEPGVAPSLPAFCTPAASPDTEGTRDPQENGQPSEMADNTASLSEIQELAGKIVANAISMAMVVLHKTGGCDSPKVEDGTARAEQEEGSGRLSELKSVTPVSNGQPCTMQEVMRDDGLTPVELHDLPRGDPSDASRAEAEAHQQARVEAVGLDAAGEVNDCLTSQQCETTGGNVPKAESRQVAVCLAQRHEVVLPVLASLKAEEAAAGSEDSGCSTCHSEEWISSEDLLHSTGLCCSAPDGKEDVSPLPGACELGIERRTLISDVHEVTSVSEAGLHNGTHANEMEADQSGSDVNSMDSVDSSCVGESLHQRGNQLSQLQTSELVIWEIEVPKHLVGRLIGKQGRYISFLKLNSGAKIYISTLPYTQDFQICHIEGLQHQVDKALALIGKKFKDLDLTNLYAPPPLPVNLPSLPMTTWLLLPSGVTVEVIVVNIVSAGHVFVQQHTHPTYHALRSLDQQMYLCYSQPGTPALPSPVKVGVICAAPALEGAWWRAQVISYCKDSAEVEIRYVDYGGYDRVKVDVLRQIRSDFVTLPFQGAEVLLDNVAPLPGADRFSTEASTALEEMTRGVALLAQVTNYDNITGLPLVQLWKVVSEELVSVNRTLVEQGLGTWVDSF